MTIGKLGGYTGTVVRDLKTMRTEMESLQRQLGTGRRADTYGELGRERSFALAFRAKQTRIEGFQATITLTETRIKVADATVSRINDMAAEAKQAIDPNQFLLLTDGRTQQQAHAANALGELMSLLNTEAGGRFVFAGKANEGAPVADLAAILDGDGSRAGLRQLIGERRAADLATSGLGRVTVARAGADVTLEEDGTHPFGFKLDGFASSSPNAAATVTAGPPASTTVSFTGPVEIGDTVDAMVRLPDGTTERIRLTVGDRTSATDRVFAAGITPDDTAENFRQALEGALQAEAGGTLSAASALATSRDFFDTFQGRSVSRVDGPPFDTATALVAADPATTVAWYRGDQSAGVPRRDAVARVDQTIEAAFGLRANERPFTELAANLAALALADVSAATAVDKAEMGALSRRVKTNVDPNTGGASVQAIMVEIATAMTATDQAKDRHAVQAGLLGEMVEGVEGIDKEEVAVRLLSLQTRMQASYQATAILSKLSIVDFL